MRVKRRIDGAVLAGVVGAALLAAAQPAHGDNEPVFVVPGRVGVPVMMYGVDVSGAVIEGEWGLNRPGVVAPTVILPYVPAPVYAPPSAYFPATGQRPRYGRLEVLPPPNRRLPRPAQPYYRLWTSESAPGPVTDYAPYEMPPVVITPRTHAHAPRPLRHSTPVPTPRTP